MTEQEIDVVLQGETDNVLPSSGFLQSVMAAVQSEAASLPAIPFPWKRALPGLVGSFGILIALLATVLKAWRSAQLWSVNSSSHLLASCKAATDILQQPATLWAVMATFLCFICIAGFRRLGMR